MGGSLELLLKSSNLLGLSLLLCAVDLTNAHSTGEVAAKTIEGLLVAVKVLLSALGLGSGKLALGKTGLQLGNANGAACDANSETRNSAAVVNAALSTLTETVESLLGTTNTALGAGNLLLDLGDLSSGETLSSEALAELGEATLEASNTLVKASTAGFTAVVGLLLLVSPALNMTSSAAVELLGTLLEASNLLLNASLLSIRQTFLLELQLQSSNASVVASNVRGETSEASLASLASLATLAALKRFLGTTVMTAGLNASAAKEELLEATLKSLRLLLQSSDLSLNQSRLIGIELIGGKSLLQAIKLGVILGNVQDEAMDPFTEGALTSQALLNAIDLLERLSHGELELNSLLLGKTLLKKSSLDLSQLLLGSDQSSLELSLALSLASSLLCLILLRCFLALLGLLTESLGKTALSTADATVNLSDALLKLLSSITSGLGDLSLKGSELSLQVLQLKAKTLHKRSFVGGVEVLNLRGQCLNLSKERFLGFGANVRLGETSAEGAKTSAELGELSLGELDLGGLLVTFTIKKSKESADLLQVGLRLDKLEVELISDVLGEALLGEADLKLVHSKLSLEEFNTLFSPGNGLLESKSLLRIETTLGLLRTELGELQFGLEKLHTEASTSEAGFNPGDVIALLGVGPAVLNAGNLQFSLEDLDLVDLVALILFRRNTAVGSGGSSEALSALIAGSLELNLNGLEFLLGSLELLHEGSSLVGGETGSGKLGLELGDAEL